MNPSNHSLIAKNHMFNIQEQPISVPDLYRNAFPVNDTEVTGRIFSRDVKTKTPPQTNRFLIPNEESAMYSRAMDILQTSQGRNFFQRFTKIAPEYDIQFSVKVEPGQMIDRRILMCCDKRHKPQQEWIDLLQAAGAPSDIVTEISGVMADADNDLTFGIEEKNDTVRLKICLEFMDSQRRKIQQGKLELKPLRLRRGYKWLADDTAKCVRDDYWFHPLTLPEIRDHMADTLKIDQAILVKLLDPLLFNNKAVSLEQVMYLEVSSDDNARRSFDITCHPCGISVREAMPYILDATQNWECREQLKQKLLPFRSHNLDHISAGTHEEQQSFLTFYINEGEISEGKNIAGVSHLPVSTDKSNSRSQSLRSEATLDHAASAPEVRKAFKTNSSYDSNSRPNFTIINMTE